MKKIIRFLVLLTVGVMLFAPLAVSAGSYRIDDTPMSVNVDDSVWYVFTRDNLAGNPELDELGLDYAEMVDYMMEDDVYLYASRFFYESGSYLDLYVQKWPQEFYWNFVDYSDSELLEIGRSTYEGIATEDNTSIYENPYNHYRYFVIEYTYEGETLLQYETIIDSTTYSFQFWTDGTFTVKQREVVKDIMDGVQYQPEISSESEKAIKLPEWLAVLIDMKWAWAAVAVVTAVILVIGIRSEKKREAKAKSEGAAEETPLAEETLPAETEPEIHDEPDSE